MTTMTMFVAGPTELRNRLAKNGNMSPTTDIYPYREYIPLFLDAQTAMHYHFAIVRSVQRSVERRGGMRGKSNGPLRLSSWSARDMGQELWMEARGRMEDLGCAVFKITMPEALYTTLADQGVIMLGSQGSPQEMLLPDCKAFKPIGRSTHGLVKITCFQGTLEQQLVYVDLIPLQPGQTSFITLEEQEKLANGKEGEEEQEKLANEKEDKKKREKPGRAKEQDAKRARQEAEEKKQRDEREGKHAIRV